MSQPSRDTSPIPKWHSLMYYVTEAPALSKTLKRRCNMKPLPYLKRMLVASIIALTLVLSIIFPAYAATRGSAQQSDQFLPRGKFTIKSVLSIDLTRDFATMPLHKGNFHCTPVWYVI